MTAIGRAGGGDAWTESVIRGGAGDGVFLVWQTGTWGEQMVLGGHFLPVFTTGLVGGHPRWPIPGGMAWWSQGAVSSGKQGMVWAGGSTSRIIGDQGMTDPGGGERVSPVVRCQPTWQLPVGHEHGPGWSSSTQAFPPLGSHPAGIHGRDNRGMPVLAQSVLGRRDRVVPDSPIGMGGSSPSVVPPVSGARRSGMGMRPAGWNSRSPRKLSVVSTSEVGKMEWCPYRVM